MASRNILSAETTALIERIDDLERISRDKRANEIARRFIAAERGKKRTRATIRPLAFPVRIAGKRCTVAVHTYYVLSRPREHVIETTYFETAIDARAAHPDARTLAASTGQTSA